MCKTEITSTQFHPHVPVETAFAGYLIASIDCFTGILVSAKMSVTGELHSEPARSKHLQPVLSAPNVPERIVTQNSVGEGGVSYTDPREKRFRNAVPVCTLPERRSITKIHLCIRHAKSHSSKHSEIKRTKPSPSHFVTDGPSAGLSWCRVSYGTHDQIFK
jgi:hypothetical protein